MPLYSLYGLTIDSDQTIQTPLAPGHGTPGLVIRRAGALPLPDGWLNQPPAFTSRMKVEEDQPLVRLYRWSEGCLACFEERWDFWITPERIVIADCRHARQPEVPGGHEFHLLGTVMALWLEMIGRPVLHASGVAPGGQVVAFLAPGTTGKSSLAASFVQAGFPLVSDDMLPVYEQEGQLLAAPGKAVVRMWPDTARVFGQEVERMRLVNRHSDKRLAPAGPGGLGPAAQAPLPLRAIYLLERGEPDSALTITPLTHANALIELMRQTFLSALMRAFPDWQPARLRQLASVARQVRMAHLRYPAGMDRIPATRAAILADLDLG